MNDYEFSFYCLEPDPILAAVLCVSKFKAAARHIEMHRWAHGIIRAKAVGSQGVSPTSSAITLVSMPTVTMARKRKLDEGAFEAAVKRRCVGSPHIRTPQSHNFILFSALSHIYHNQIQNNLNAKHGARHIQNNPIMYQNCRQFQCCYLVPQRLREQAALSDPLIGSLSIRGVPFDAYLFVTTKQEELDQFRGLKVFFTNFREHFSTQADFVTNFCRFYYWQASGQVVPRNDLLYFCLFLLAQNSWLYRKKLHRSCLNNFVNNPIFSIFTGGLIEHIKKNNFDDINSEKHYHNAIINRLLNRPINVGLSVNKSF